MLERHARGAAGRDAPAQFGAEISAEAVRIRLPNGPELRAACGADVCWVGLLLQVRSGAHARPE